MRQILLIASFFLTGLLFSQTNIFDTLFFADKKFAIKKNGTNSLMSGQDFPFAVFYCEYEFNGKPWTYSSIKECNCKKVGTMFDVQGNPLAEKICDEGEEMIFTEYNLLDSLTIDLRNCRDTPRIKASNKVSIINSIQYKIVYDNSSRTLSATNENQFATLQEYLIRHPGFKFIVVEDMYYKDKKEKLYRLPFTFILRQK